METGPVSNTPAGGVLDFLPEGVEGLTAKEREDINMSIFAGAMIPILIRQNSDLFNELEAETAEPDS